MPALSSPRSHVGKTCVSCANLLSLTGYKILLNWKLLPHALALSAGHFVSRKKFLYECEHALGETGTHEMDVMNRT